MPTELLTSELFIPPRRPGLAPRPRLVQLLKILAALLNEIALRIGPLILVRIMFTCPPQTGNIYANHN